VRTGNRPEKGERKKKKVSSEGKWTAKGRDFWPGGKLDLNKGKKGNVPKKSEKNHRVRKEKKN